jgi:hypothetical protein
VLAVTHLDRLAGLPPRVCTGYFFQPDDAPTIDHQGESDCFVRDGDRVTALRAGRRGDLAYQERLGRALGRCRPVHTPVQGTGPEAFLGTVERELGVPVGLTSCGPSARDKRVVGPAWL